MKIIIINNQLTCIGKIDEIIDYLTDLQNKYSTVKEYIEKKQLPLKK